MRIELISEKIEILRLQLEDEIRICGCKVIINDKICSLSSELDFLILEYMKSIQKN